jgi:hypothetical protein
MTCGAPLFQSVLGDDTEKILALREFCFQSIESPVRARPSRIRVTEFPRDRVSVDFSGLADVSFTSASIAKLI